jgi:phage shock protein PspC (stress-responsive transcriptional regulator)
MKPKLTRSHTDQMIGGVCGGLGKYLGIDPTFVRLFFVLLAFAGNGIGVLVYLLLWIILPVEGQTRPASFEENVRLGSEEVAERARHMGDDFRNMVQNPHPQASLIIGASLIILGIVYLIDNMQLPWLQWLRFDIVWPLLLVLGGIALILRRGRGE